MSRPEDHGDACPEHETLLAWMLGRLSSEDIVKIGGHVNGCDGCADMLAELDDSNDRLTLALRHPGDEEPFEGAQEDDIVQAASEIGELAVDVILPGPTPGDLPESLRSIGRWELQDVVGRGSMGLVCRATDPGSGDLAAIKVIPDVTPGRRLERFQREISIARSLRHPGIVRSVDGGVQDGTPYLVMEWLDGLNLQRVLRRAKHLTVAETADIGRQVAAALTYSAAQGVVHRDIKPSNLMLIPGGEIKVLDFGLARVNLDTEPLDDLTSSSQLLGTADYIAPEQTHDPRAVDIRADLYSLGCLLFHCVTGEPPFNRYASPLQKLWAHRSEDFPPIESQNAGIPDEFCRIIVQLCARERDDRAGTPEQVVSLLEAWTDGSDLQGLLKRAQWGSDPGD